MNNEPILTTVYIPGPDGDYATNVYARSSQEAARKAIQFFNDSFWKGPKPAPDTILRISPMHRRAISVRTGDALRF